MSIRLLNLHSTIYIEILSYIKYHCRGVVSGPVWDLTIIKKEVYDNFDNEKKKALY